MYSVSSLERFKIFNAENTEDTEDAEKNRDISGRNYNNPWVSRNDRICPQFEFDLDWHTGTRYPD